MCPYLTRITIDKERGLVLTPSRIDGIHSSQRTRTGLVLRYRKGDPVAASRQIDGMNVPAVPRGTRGTVLTTTVFGRPKRVFFSVSDGWGLKRFHVEVRRGDVERIDGQ